MSREAKRRVYICNLPDYTVHSAVVHIPYIWGVLRNFSMQDERLQDSYEFAEPLWRNEVPASVLDRIEEPSVVGLSVYVWNERNSHRLAQMLKERYPEVLIVFGGPQIPSRPSTYLQDNPWVDILVHGEGEEPFRGLLLENLNSNPDWSNVPGLSHLRDEEQCFSRPGERLRQLDFPSPYLNGNYDSMMKEIREENSYATVMACMETNRGCPYSCSFCDWGMATMSKLRRHEVQRVRDEFEWASLHKVQGIILNDANFGILPRDVGLAEHLASLKAKHGFPQNFYPLGLAKNNKDRAFAINKLIIDNGFDPFEMNVNFSLQATNQLTLDAIHRQNIPLDNYRVLADRYAKEGYKLTPDLILPLPGETLESFQQGYADLASWDHVARIRVYPCGILPNAPMASPEYREKWGLVTRLVPLGRRVLLGSQAQQIETEMIETVVATNTMTEQEHGAAKIFLALVNALELYGLTRAIRQFVGLELGWSAAEFYLALWESQVELEGVLHSALRSMEAPVLGHSYGDELIGTGIAKTHDGQRLKAHKVLAYDFLTRSERAIQELTTFLDSLDLEFDRELLRYQSDLWLTPGVDPTQPFKTCYQWNWPRYLSGESSLLHESTEIVYPALARWVESGYEVGGESWRSLALAPCSVDTPCLRV